MSPRALGAIVRPRLQSGVIRRPLNFTVSGQPGLSLSAVPHLCITLEENHHYLVDHRGCRSLALGHPWVCPIHHAGVSLVRLVLVERLRHVPALAPARKRTILVDYAAR